MSRELGCIARHFRARTIETALNELFVLLKSVTNQEERPDWGDVACLIRAAKEISVAVESYRATFGGHAILDAAELPGKTVHLAADEGEHLLFRAYEESRQAIDFLESSRRSQTAAVFGEWGGYFLELCEDRIPPDIYDDREYKVDDVIDFRPTLDEAAFTCEVLGRPPLYLGNTKEFRLLAAIVAEFGKYQSHLSLIEKIGGDDLSPIHVTKSRLCKRLRDCGYSDIADGITSTPGHYALGFSSARNL